MRVHVVIEKLAVGVADVLRSGYRAMDSAAASGNSSSWAID